MRTVSCCSAPDAVQVRGSAQQTVNKPLTASFDTELELLLVTVAPAFGAHIHRRQLT